jgi:nicotinate phosphoribosyltransferase
MTTPSALFTDLYELTMAQAYAAQAVDQTAVFELFFRKLPDERNYLLAFGLEDVFDYLENLRFEPEDIDYLETLDRFSDGFLERLAGLRFTGDVYAPAEGTVMFPSEPVLQIVAPIMEAQVVETYLLNQMHFQSVLGTKAARVITAANGKAVADYGARRAHGSDAALKAARVTYLAGGAGTSNLAAGLRYGIPVMGTMAHSYIQAHDDERDALTDFIGLYPGTTVLVDTYGTLQGVQKVIDLAKERGDSFNVGAIRLDSGDLAILARQSRAMLDEAGLKSVHIVASGGLDEFKIAALGDAPIDAFGVGTKMVISTDAPDIDCAYKLVEYAGHSRLKASAGKTLFPGRKQVWRTLEDGLIAGDTIGCYEETFDGESLLQPVMQNGRRLPDYLPSLDNIRNHTRQQLQQLPHRLHVLGTADVPYPVKLSERLAKEAQEMLNRIR